MTSPPRPGTVTDVDYEQRLFAAEFDCGLVATFDLDLLPDAEAGDAVLVYDDRIEYPYFGVWTRQELEGIRARARIWAQAIEALTDPAR